MGISFLIFSFSQRIYEELNHSFICYLNCNTEWKVWLWQILWTELSQSLFLFFFCHIHNYTEYNQQWNVFSAFNPSKCTHTWSSVQPTLRHPGSSWGFGALLKGLTSVVDNSCRSRDSNPQPRVTSPTLYSLGHGCPVSCHLYFIAQITQSIPFLNLRVAYGFD